MIVCMPRTVAGSRLKRHDFRRRRGCEERQGDYDQAKKLWSKCVDLESDWSAKKMIDILRLWNFKQDDISKVMEGVYKAGIARP